MAYCITLLSIICLEICLAIKNLAIRVYGFVLDQYLILSIKRLPGVVIFDSNNKCIFCSDYSLELIGPVKNIVDLVRRTRYHKSVINAFKEVYRSGFVDSISVSFTMENKNLNFSIAKVKNHVVVVVISNISSSQSDNSPYRKIIDRTPDPYCIVSVITNRVISCNEVFARAYPEALSNGFNSFADQVDKLRDLSGRYPYTSRISRIRAAKINGISRPGILLEEIYRDEINITYLVHEFTEEKCAILAMMDIAALHAPIGIAIMRAGEIFWCNRQFSIYLAGTYNCLSLKDYLEYESFLDLNRRINSLSSEIGLTEQRVRITTRSGKFLEFCLRKITGGINDNLVMLYCYIPIRMDFEREMALQNLSIFSELSINTARAVTDILMTAIQLSRSRESDCVALCRGAINKISYLLSSERNLE